MLRVTVTMVITFFSTLLDKGEENYALIRQQLLKELKAHKESYTMLYQKKNIFISFMNLSFLVLVVRHLRKMDCLKANATLLLSPPRKFLR